MLKIAGLVICGILIYILLKQYRPEFAVISELVCGCLLLWLVADELREVLGAFSSVFSQGGVSSEYLAVLIKIAGVALISQFAADSCRDAGENALALKVEFAGKIIITAAALPVFKGVLGLITGLMEKI